MSAILKRDLRGFFTSPIGYVYVGAFILTANLYFFLSNIFTSYQYSSVAPVFSFLLIIVMFTTPILTMRTFSEDLRQKTDQLLLTSPVKLTSIVLGKFLAAFSVFCLVMAITLVWPLIIAFFGTPNTAEIIGNYIAMLAVTAVYISIGLFVSSLTENQLVAAVGALGIFIALYLLDLASSLLSSSIPAWLSSVLAFISVFGRFSTLSMGVFSIADIVFFLSAAAVFLFLSVRVLEKKRWA